MLGAFIGWLAGSVLRIRRAHVEAAMTRAGIVDARTAAAAMYRALGRSLVALLRGGPLPNLDDAFMNAVEQAGPIVLFASHTDNWELTAAAAAKLLAPRGQRLFIVAKPMSTRWVDRLIGRIRHRLGVHVIAPRGAIAAAGRALANGDVVALPIDQVPDRAALTVPFLGAPALVDRAPATIAWRARATVLVIGGTRVIDVISRPPAGARAGDWIDETSRRATRALEAYVLQEPASWLWLHRRWRGLASSAARANPGPWRTRSSSQAGASAAG